mmetsp:Transcript_28834/g.73096  ORF Transcript_28834/g.73096 Transcript_28834/m.73096 type:complete len:908 (-) Transcript_28834:3-2726(-)
MIRSQPDNRGRRRSQSKNTGADRRRNESVRLLVICAGPSLERARPLLDKLATLNVTIEVLTDEHLAGESLKVPHCDALLVLWSHFFHGIPGSRLKQIAEKMEHDGVILLNDVNMLIEMQDRRTLLGKLVAAGVQTPGSVVCSRDEGHEPVLEEREDYIVIGGKRINKPFVEKPVDRRDREIYIYYPKAAGGGRALASTVEAGDVEYICRFEAVSRVRRACSFVYQEFMQTGGFMVQAVCVGKLAYGNALLAGVVNSKGSTSSPKVSVPCAVRLRQEEKLIASTLSGFFGQILFGITFARSQTSHGSGTSNVIDVWPAIPRAGIGSHCDDVARALHAAICDRLWPRWRPNMPLVSVSRAHSASDFATLSHWQGAAGQAVSVDVSTDDETLSPEDEVDCVAVLLVARHSERTPKQKVKASIKMQSEYAAGWLFGWLAGADVEASMATAPPGTYDLRSSEQLARLGEVADLLRTEGHEVGTLVDALARITSEGLACHAKVEVEGNKVKVTVKWGGELTPAGVEDAELFGRSFREQVYPSEDIEELHATLQHDVKVYASEEMRCQQTAAAFCRGLLHLGSALPPIIAAFVRTDKFDTTYQKTPTSDDGIVFPPVESPWALIEEAAGCTFRAPLLLEFPDPAAALRDLITRMRRVVEALQQDMRGPLYMCETAALLRERYRDSVCGLGTLEKPRLANVSHMLDHLQYDCRRNRSALPQLAIDELDAALPLCEAISDVFTRLAASLQRKAGPSSRDAERLSLLRKLRWDIRVASGGVASGDDASHNKHEALYSQVAAASSGKPCVRTRLYFNHHSRLEALMSVLLSEEPNCVDEKPKMGFLSSIVIQLWRRSSSGALHVSCEFSADGTPERKRIPVFHKPLSAVDAWWSEVLDTLRDPEASPSGSPGCWTAAS